MKYRILEQKYKNRTVYMPQKKEYIFWYNMRFLGCSTLTEAKEAIQEYQIFLDSIDLQEEIVHDYSLEEDKIR